MRKTPNNKGSHASSPQILAKPNNDNSKYDNDNVYMENQSTNYQSDMPLEFQSQLLPFENEYRPPDNRLIESQLLQNTINELRKELNQLLTTDSSENEKEDNMNKNGNINISKDDQNNRNRGESDDDFFISNNENSYEDDDISDVSSDSSDDNDDYGYEEDGDSNDYFNDEDSDSSHEDSNSSDEDSNSSDEDSNSSDEDNSSSDEENHIINENDGFSVQNIDNNNENGNFEDNYFKDYEYDNDNDFNYDENFCEDNDKNDKSYREENGIGDFNNNENNEYANSSEKVDGVRNDNNEINKNTNYENLQTFQKDFKKFFNAKFLTQKAKLEIYNFINQKKYSKIPMKQKCDTINISRKTISNYKNKKMDVLSQKDRNKKKGRRQKLSKKEKEIFIKKCRAKRDEQLAVTTKYAQKLIEKITDKFGHKWRPCETTIGNIFRSCGWSNRKSQKRHPKSDPIDKPKKIRKFYRKLKKEIRSNNLGKNRVHIMDETGLYSDSIPPNTWTFNKDKEAYVKSTGSSRRDTLVATIRADGKGFATFIEHRDQKTRKCKKTGKKIIIDQGVKGMNIEEMKKWNKEFFKHSQKGDILIMDNLGAHHNKDVLEELKSHHIKVIFFPVRCADVLSVLDNCFFAIYKKHWYRKVIKISNIDQKKREAIKLFNKLISKGFGKKMYKLCKYSKLFKNNKSQNESTNTQNEETIN